MEKRIKYIEIGIDHAGIKETGLLLHYDQNTKNIKIVKSHNNVTWFNLDICTICSIVVLKETYLAEKVIFKNEAHQKEAIEEILRLLTELKTENRCDASGYINLSSYVDYPEKYEVQQYKGKDDNSGVVDTKRLNENYFPNKVPCKIKPFFLTTTTHYYSVGLGNANNKIRILKRSSELPSEKSLKSMEKKVEQVMLSNYKLKVEPLPEIAADYVVERTFNQQYYENMYGM